MDRYCFCGGKLYCKERHPSSDLLCNKCKTTLKHNDYRIQNKLSNYQKLKNCTLEDMAKYLEAIIYLKKDESKEEIAKWLKEKP